MEKKTSLKSIGIILDGNRRWARERGMHTLEGHRRGFENLKNITKFIAETDIEDMAVYAFSTENWNRSPEEVAYLMDLFVELFSSIDEIKRSGVKIKVVGKKTLFSKKLQELIANAEDETKNNKNLTLWIALSYGGRLELSEAARVLIEKTNKSQIITEELFKSFMWSAELPDFDILIRTGGEHRLSNFFPWQSAYAELFFEKKYWPEFSIDDLKNIFDKYKKRHRRFGK